METTDLAKRFAGWANITPEDEAIMEEIHTAAFNLAILINKRCPEGREASLSITSLEQAVMWTDEALKRRPKHRFLDK